MDSKTALKYTTQSFYYKQIVWNEDKSAATEN